MDPARIGNARSGTSGTTRHALGNAGRGGARGMRCVQGRVIPGVRLGGFGNGERRGGHHVADRGRMRGGRHRSPRRSRARAGRPIRRREPLHAPDRGRPCLGIRDRAHGRRQRARARSDGRRDANVGAADRFSRGDDHVSGIGVDRSAVRRRHDDREHTGDDRRDLALLRQRHQRDDALSASSGGTAIGVPSCWSERCAASSTAVSATASCRFVVGGVPRSMQSRK